jgi:uncharacterized Zn finger protein
MTLEYNVFERAVKRNFSKAILARGELLFKKGNVIDFHKVDGYSPDWHSYEAIVIGSRGDGYNVILEFFNNGIVAECSCAYGYDCKHAAAVAFHILSAEASPVDVKKASPAAVQNHPVQAPAKIDPQVVLDNWLRALTATSASTITAKARVAVASEMSAFYLID